MNRFVSSCAIILLFGVSGFFAEADESAEGTLSRDEIEHFERRIRPLLSEHCYECHSGRAKTLHGGLRLDSAEHLLRGGDSGAVIAREKPEESLLLQTLRYDGDIQMPPRGKLDAKVIAELSDWVRRGAPFPPSNDEADQATANQPMDFEQGRRFWSFQPVRRHDLPVVKRSEWPLRRMDWFVLSSMESAGLTPSPEADRRTLVRRLYFDVIGLPPTPEQVQAFVADDSADALERLVERLLQSPQYGEKWARLWLDMARYTDRTASWLYNSGEPHLYRDWVVNAMNSDMPYDDFVRRQLATDLMDDTGPEDLPALGFLGLSPTYWKELKLPCEIIKVIVADEWEERVDVVSRTFLGLTVACARCHDHKFDPISSEDYYALAGVFASCRQSERPTIAESLYEPVRKAKSKVESLQAELDKLKKAKPQPAEKIGELTAQIKQIQESTPHYHTPMASALVEESLHVVRAGQTAQDGTRLDYRPEPQDLPLFVRGNPNRPGPLVPRRFLTVLSQQSQPFQNGSGRLELANALTTDAAALMARVIVNRIWAAHFGRGIVTTPSDFGKQGAAPSHPELLDDLAAGFIRNGWSLRNLHREILLSATYRQSSRHDVQRESVDPANQWLSRMNRHRLDFEAWRDAMLAASGQLDLTMGGPSLDVDSPDNNRRTLYSTVHRREMATTLTIHDFPDPGQHSDMRSPTTTALQGLFALNGALPARAATLLAQRLHTECATDVERVDRAYQLLLSRAPTDAERNLGQTFVNAVSADHERKTGPWEQYLHVLLASNEFLFLD